MHTRIQEAFGPMNRGTRDKGMGGATTGPDRFPTIAPADELNRLAETIKEEGIAVKANLAGFDEATRRSHGRGPDAATIARIRGDKNRAFLMD